MLNLSLERYDELVSKPSVHGKNSDGFRSGNELYNAFLNNDPAVQSVGRNGGLKGSALTEDISSGRWKTQQYEYSASKNNIQNWFSIKEFVEAVKE
jgi:hypothetical protein